MKATAVFMQVAVFVSLSCGFAVQASETPLPASQQVPAPQEASPNTISPLYAVVRKDATGIDHSADGCNPFVDAQPMQRGDLVVMVRAVHCPKRIRGNGAFIEVLYEGKRLLATIQDVQPDTKDLDALFDMRPADIEASLALWVADSIRIAGQGKRTEEKAKKKVIEKIRKSAVQGLTVLKAGIHDVSEYTDGTGFSLSVYNSSQKVIKYVTATYRGKNAVGDPVRDSFNQSASKTLKGIGPIAVGESGSYSKDYVWLTDVVESFTLDSIKVDFMDGTSRVTQGSKITRLSPDEYELMFGEQ